MSNTELSGRGASPLLAAQASRKGGLVLLLLALYLLIDWASFLYPLHNLNITPWNPLAGLSLFILVRYGLSFAPLILIGRVLGDIALRANPTSIEMVVLGGLLIVTGYALAAHLLRNVLKIDQRLTKLRDVVALVAATVGVAILISSSYVTALGLAGAISWDDALRATLRRFTGDVIGILTLLPPLLILAHRWDTHRRPLIDLTWEHLAQITSIIGLLWLIFGLKSIDEFKFFYLLFLPIIWMAMRSGLAGAVAGVLVCQIALIVVLRLLGEHSGQSVTVIQVLMIVLAATGMLLGTVVSERQQVETLLRNSEKRMQTIIGTIPDGMVTIRGDGSVESLNPSATQLFDVREDQVIGKPASDLLPIFAERPLLPAATSLETVARRRDGVLVPVEMTVNTAIIGDEPLVVGMARDITGRKVMEARLAQKQTELNQVNRRSVTGELAGVMAHEINQPLTAIVNYARVCQMLIDAPEGDPVLLRETLGKTLLQATRAGEIIRRLREFLGRGDSFPAIEDPRSILLEAIELIEADARNAGINLGSRLPPALPPVLADRIQIQQVLTNLIRNALEAVGSRSTGPRGVVVEASPSPSGEEVTVRVSDTGPGIHDDVADRLFLPFASTKATGMGLGLSISRSIIEAHGGRLWHEAAPGGGAAFIFTLPAATERDSHD